MKLELLIFFISMGFLSYSLNYIFIGFAQKMGTVSVRADGQERWDHSSKPIVGGLSFFFCFLIAGWVASWMNPESFQNYVFTKEFIALLCASTLGFIVGLADDAYSTKPLYKFGGQFLCGVIFLLAGLEIKLFNIYPLDAVLTLFWVVGIMNSVNMLDNMDGITATISASILACAISLIYLLGLKETFYLPLFIGVLASLIGFLVLNYHPSKLYMGDTGSQFIGAFLAFVGIKFFWNLPTNDGELIFTRQIIFAVLVFLIPILDTSFVSVARLRRGQSPFVGGRDHTTHHLSYMGISARVIPIIFAGITMLSSVLIHSSFTIKSGWSHYVTLLYASYIVSIFAVFLYLYQKGLYAKKQKELEKNNVQTNIENITKVVVTK